jgi:hypothetical protein
MNPVAKCTGGDVAPAPRLSTLSDKTIGIYWNTKAGGDVALQRVAEIIQKDFPGVRFNNYVHHPPTPSDMIEDMLSQCDAVIGSTGD